MSNKTLEVELGNGHVRTAGGEMLPAKAQSLLTLLDSPVPSLARTCGELAEHWAELEMLPSGEAMEFADDMERGRASLPLIKPAWD